MDRFGAKLDLDQVADRLTESLGVPAATNEGFQWLLEQHDDRGPIRIRIRLDGVGGLTTLDLLEERADGHDTAISLVIQSLAQLDRTIHALDSVRADPPDLAPPDHAPTDRPRPRARSDPRGPASD